MAHRLATCSAMSPPLLLVSPRAVRERVELLDGKQLVVHAAAVRLDSNGCHGDAEPM